MAATQTEKGAAPVVGNAFAYFIVVIWMKAKGYITEDNVAEAVAFGGAIITWIGLQVRAIFMGIGAAIRWAVGLIRKDEPTPNDNDLPE